MIQQIEPIGTEALSSNNNTNTLNAEDWKQDLSLDRRQILINALVHRLRSQYTTLSMEDLRNRISEHEQIAFALAEDKVRGSPVHGEVELDVVIEFLFTSRRLNFSRSYFYRLASFDASRYAGRLGNVSMNNANAAGSISSKNSSDEDTDQGPQQHDCQCYHNQFSPRHHLNPFHSYCSNCGSTTTTNNSETDQCAGALASNNTRTTSIDMDVDLNEYWNQIEEMRRHAVTIGKVIQLCMRYLQTIPPTQTAYRTRFQSTLTRYLSMKMLLYENRAQPRYRPSHKNLIVMRHMMIEINEFERRERLQLQQQQQQQQASLAATTTTSTAMTDNIAVVVPTSPPTSPSTAMTLPEATSPLSSSLSSSSNIFDTTASTTTTITRTTGLKSKRKFAQISRE